jgi:hypothetical protein
MNISKESCTWCQFNGNLCNKGEKKVEFFT